MKEDKNYVRVLKTKISKISDLIKLSSLSIVTIKNCYFDSEIMSTMYHIYETELGKRSFDSYLKNIIKVVLDEDANRKVDNIKFNEEKKLFFVTTDEDGKLVFEEINEQNIFSFIKPDIEDYFTDFMFLPVVECDEYYLNQARFSKLKNIHNIVGLGFLLTYDYSF